MEREQDNKLSSSIYILAEVAVGGVMRDAGVMAIQVESCSCSSCMHAEPLLTGKCYFEVLDIEILRGGGSQRTRLRGIETIGEFALRLMGK